MWCGVLTQELIQAAGEPTGLSFVEQFSRVLRPEPEPMSFIDQFSTETIGESFIDQFSNKIENPFQPTPKKVPDFPLPDRVRGPRASGFLQPAPDISAGGAFTSPIAERDTRTLQNREAIKGAFSSVVRRRSIEVHDASDDAIKPIKGESESQRLQRKIEWETETIYNEYKDHPLASMSPELQAMGQMVFHNKIEKSKREMGPFFEKRFWDRMVAQGGKRPKSKAERHRIAAMDHAFPSGILTAAPEHFGPTGGEALARNFTTRVLEAAPDLPTDVLTGTANLIFGTKFRKAGEFEQARRDLVPPGEGLAGDVGSVLGEVTAFMVETMSGVALASKARAIAKKGSKAAVSFSKKQLRQAPRLGRSRGVVPTATRKASRDAFRRAGQSNEDAFFADISRKLSTETGQSFQKLGPIARKDFVTGRRLKNRFGGLERSGSNEALARISLRESSDSMESALDDGKSDTQAVMSGVGIGVLVGLTEMAGFNMVGKITDDIVLKLGRKMITRDFEAATGLLAGIFGGAAIEGSEELGQLAGTNIWNAIIGVTPADTAIANIKQSAVKSFALGALGGAVGTFPTQLAQSAATLGAQRDRTRIRERAMDLSETVGGAASKLPRKHPLFENQKNYRTVTNDAGQQEGVLTTKDGEIRFTPEEAAVIESAVTKAMLTSEGTFPLTPAEGAALNKLAQTDVVSELGLAIDGKADPLDVDLSEILEPEVAEPEPLAPDEIARITPVELTVNRENLRDIPAINVDGTRATTSPAEASEIEATTDTAEDAQLDEALTEVGFLLAEFDALDEVATEDRADDRKESRGRKKDAIKRRREARKKVRKLSVAQGEFQPTPAQTTEQTPVVPAPAPLAVEFFPDPDGDEAADIGLGWVKQDGSLPQTGEAVTLTGHRGHGREDVNEPFTDEVVKQSDGDPVPVLGFGYYIAPDAGEASGYGPVVDEHEITLSNPLVVESLSDLDPFVEKGDKVKGKAKARLAVTGVQDFTKYRNVGKRAEEAGHDGIIVIVPADSDTNSRGENIKPLRRLFGGTQVFIPSADRPTGALEPTFQQGVPHGTPVGEDSQLSPMASQQNEAPQAPAPAPIPPPQTEDQAVARQFVETSRKNVRNIVATIGGKKDAEIIEAFETLNRIVENSEDTLRNGTDTNGIEVDKDYATALGKLINEASQATRDIMPVLGPVMVNEALVTVKDRGEYGLEGTARLLVNAADNELPPTLWEQQFAGAGIENVWGVDGTENPLDVTASDPIEKLAAKEIEKGIVEKKRENRLRNLESRSKVDGTPEASSDDAQVDEFGAGELAMIAAEAIASHPDARTPGSAYAFNAAVEAGPGRAPNSYLYALMLDTMPRGTARKPKRVLKQSEIDEGERSKSLDLQHSMNVKAIRTKAANKKGRKFLPQPSMLPVGTTFEINGNEFQVVEAKDGTKFIVPDKSFSDKKADSEDAIPVEGLDRGRGGAGLPMDTKTIKFGATPSPRKTEMANDAAGIPISESRTPEQLQQLKRINAAVKKANELEGGDKPLTEQTVTERVFAELNARDRAVWDSLTDPDVKFGKPDIPFDAAFLGFAIVANYTHRGYIIAKTLAAMGAMDFIKWSSAMIETHGQDVVPMLKPIYNDLRNKDSALAEVMTPIEVVAETDLNDIPAFIPIRKKVIADIGDSEEARQFSRLVVLAQEAAGQPAERTDDSVLTAAKETIRKDPSGELARILLLDPTKEVNQLDSVIAQSLAITAMTEGMKTGNIQQINLAVELSLQSRNIKTEAARTLRSPSALHATPGQRFVQMITSTVLEMSPGDMVKARELQAAINTGTETVRGGAGGPGFTVSTVKLTENQIAKKHAELEKLKRKIRNKIEHMRIALEERNLDMASLLRDPQEAMAEFLERKRQRDERAAQRTSGNNDPLRGPQGELLEEGLDPRTRISEPRPDVDVEPIEGATSGPQPIIPGVPSQPLTDPSLTNTGDVEKIPRTGFQNVSEDVFPQQPDSPPIEGATSGPQPTIEGLPPQPLADPGNEGDVSVPPGDLHLQGELSAEGLEGREQIFDPNLHPLSTLAEVLEAGGSKEDLGSAQILLPGVLRNYLNAARDASLKIEPDGNYWARFWNGATTIYLSFLLSGIQTAERNIMGNSMYFAYDTLIQRPAEAAVNAVVTGVTGRQDASAPRFSEFRGLARAFFKPNTKEEIAAAETATKRKIAKITARAQTRALFNAIDAAIYERPMLEEEINAVRVLTGKKPIEETSSLDSEQIRKVLGTGKLGRTLRAPLTGLLIADEFAKGMIYEMQMHALALRKGEDLGLEGDELIEYMDDQVKNHGGELAELSLDKARELTFQKRIEWLEGMVNNLKHQGPARGFFWTLFFPFVRTPGNLYGIALAKLPPIALGRLTKHTVFSYGRTNDGVPVYSRGRAVKSATDLMIGSIATALMWMLINDKDEEGNPRITGTVPFGQAASELSYRLWQPQSIRLGNQWYSIRGIEPFDTLFTTNVDILSDMADRGVMDPNTWFAVGSSLVRGAEAKTTLVGLTTLAGLVTSFRAGTPTDKLAKFIGRTSAGVVPNLIRQGVREKNEFILQNNVNVKRDGFFPSVLRAFSNETQLEPFFPNPKPRVDLLGRPVERGHSPIPGVSDAFWRIFSMIDSQEVGIYKWDWWMASYNERFPDKKLAFTRPSRMFKSPVDGTPIIMTDQEYYDFEKRTGTWFRNYVESLPLSPDAPDLMMKQTAKDADGMLQSFRRMGRTIVAVNRVRNGGVPKD